MKEIETKEVINKIFKGVFGCLSPYSIEEIKNKFAFDIKLPQQVNDFTTNEITWADCVNSCKFITNKNMEKRDNTVGWMLPKRNVCGLQEIIDIWSDINLVTTERVYDSIEVVKSDTIYGCEKVYRSTNCSDSKNLIYCDSCVNSEFLLASQRSFICNFCIRCDDSKDCSNSYNVICSNKIVNSFFVQDCFDLFECMFCSHISSKKYCIANMQFSKEEYYDIKKLIVDWILKS